MFHDQDVPGGGPCELGAEANLAVMTRAGEPLGIQLQHRSVYTPLVNGRHGIE